MSRPPDDLKAFCDRLAHDVSEPVGASLVRRLQLAGLLGRRPDQAAAAAGGATPADRERVGIWERRRGDAGGFFVRRADLAAEWRYWANAGRIEPRGARRRIVLIGESVARGHLYDPEHTPAMVLAAILEAHWGKGQVEVIDLARTNLGFELREIAAAALLLQPDAVVLFAGNNWRAATSAADLPRLGPLLAAEGVPGLRRLAEERLAGGVSKLVAELSAVYRPGGVPLVWLLPEANLDDWREPPTQAPHLAAGDNARWLADWRAASAAWDAGDLDAAAEQARHMTVLDGSTSGTGWTVLADCARRRGDLAAARRCLAEARDAAIWDGSRVVSPRPYSIAQRTLREAAAAHGQPVVDLPAVFADYLDGGVPGRRLFLDYCHLTGEGMQVAMAAAAAAVLAAVARTEVPWRRLIDDAPFPAPAVEAGAAFLAAVHNAHWWQGYELIHHHCRRALQASADIAPVMTRFIEIQLRQTPMDMSRAAEELAELGSPLISHYLLRDNNQQLDRLLIAAIEAALAEAGVDTGGASRRLLREERSLRQGAADLLDFFYLSAAVQPQEVMWVMQRGPEAAGHLTPPDWYRAYSPESIFCFAGEAGRAVRLRLACRLPGARPAPDLNPAPGRNQAPSPEPAPGPGPAAAHRMVAVALNGGALAERALDGAWCNWEIEVPGERVIEGVNQLTVRWPVPEFPGESALAAVVDDLIDEIVPDMYPIFGEIHSLTAEDAGGAEAVAAAARGSG